MTEFACAVVAALSAIITAVVTTRNNARGKKDEHRADQRAKESRLMLDMIYANMQLSIGTAMAIKTIGKANNELLEGLNAVRKCNDKYNEFLQDIAFDHLVK